MPRAETGCDSKELIGAQVADEKSREIEFEGSWLVVLTKKSHMSEAAPQNGRRQNGAVFMGHLLEGRSSTVHVEGGGGTCTPSRNISHHILDIYLQD